MVHHGTPARRAGIALGLGGTLLLSSESLVVRAVDAGSWDVAFWAGAATAVVTAIAIAIRHPPDLGDHASPLIVSGALQAVSGTTFILAVNATTVANVVVLLAVAPAAAAIVARVTLGESTSRRVWTAIAIAGAGVAVVVGDSLGGGRLRGDLYALVAVAAFAVNVTVWRRHPAMSRTAAIGLGGLLMAVVAAGPARITGLHTRDYVLLVLLGAVIGPLARVSIASATRYLRAAEVALFVPVETVAATTWAWLAFDERPDPATVVGGVIVLAAVTLGLGRGGSRAPLGDPAPGDRSV